MAPERLNVTGLRAAARLSDPSGRLLGASPVQGAGGAIVAAGQREAVTDDRARVSATGRRAGACRCRQIRLD